MPLHNQVDSLLAEILKHKADQAEMALKLAIKSVEAERFVYYTVAGVVGPSPRFQVNEGTGISSSTYGETNVGGISRAAVTPG